jgi:hypothetical protein
MTLKRLLLALLILWPLPAASQTFVLDSACVIGHGVSKHFQRRNWPVAGADWQERNWGIGACVRWRTPEWRFIRSVAISGGVYRNSLSSNAIPGRRWDWSQYVTVDADLLGWHKGRWSVEAGPVVGFALGYRNHPVVPIIGARAALRYAITDNVGLSLVGMAHPFLGRSKGNVNLSVRLDWRF